MVLTVFFTTGLAIVLGYAVLKSGSISSLTPYLHALNDQVVGFIVRASVLPSRSTTPSLLVSASTE